MSEAKLRVSITLPGGVMYTRQLCLKTSEETIKGKKVKREVPIEGMCEHTHLAVPHIDPKTGKRFTGHYDIYVPKSKPANQVITMTKDAYDYFVSSAAPAWFRVAGKNRNQTQDIWKKLPEEERIRVHLNRVAESFGGELADFQILDD